MTEEIIQNNIIIAKFMGAEFVNDDPETYPKGYYIGIEGASQPENFEYINDWNWLMSVFDKIEEFDFGDSDHPYIRTFYKNMVRINRFSLHQEETKHLSAYNAVVEFINWYNLNHNA